MGLYDFQREGLSRVNGKENVAFYWDMGLGKTYVGTAQMAKFNGRLNLVLCQKSKMDDWYQHLYWNVTGDVILLDKKHQKNDIIKCVFNRNPNGLTIICNYELAWRRPILADYPWDVIMLDESSIIQNAKAKITKFVMGLHYKHCILLSGTPCSGKYENLWSQAVLLGWDISKSVFESTYVNWERFYIGRTAHFRPCKNNPYKNVERLKDKLRKHGADFLKTDMVIELPEQMITTIPIKSSDEYLRFKMDRFVEFGDKPPVELIGDSIMAWRIGLRRLCAEYSEYKIDAIMDLLSSSNERFIIFYNWNSELKLLMTLANELGRPISIVNGKEKDLEAYEEECDSITLVQYQAGAMGLNLQKAQRIIYFSLPERTDLFEQSKKRIHRLGQKSTCWYYIPLTERSIETGIYKALQERRDYTDELFKEDMKEWI